MSDVDNIDNLDKPFRKPKKISKELYTKIFLSSIGKSVDKVNVQHHMNKIWKSRRNKELGGLQLSLEGFDFLVDEVGLQYYEIPFTESVELSPNLIVFFDRFMDGPYLLSTKSLIVFTEKKSFEIHLFSNDIKKYGLLKAMNELNREIPDRGVLDF